MELVSSQAARTPCGKGEGPDKAASAGLSVVRRAAPSGSHRRRLTQALLGLGAGTAILPPVMVSADMSGLIVALPLFIAGLAVGAAAFVASRSQNVAAPEPVRITSADSQETSALPIADILGVPAFLVSRAGLIHGVNEAGYQLLKLAPGRLDTPLLLDLLAPSDRSVAMAALHAGEKEGAEIELRDGSRRSLHIVKTEGPDRHIALLSPCALAASDTGENPAATVASAMLATVSHELRTPLNAIIGFSGILEQELFGALGSDRQREYVDLIQKSGQHLLSVVNELLDVSKMQAGRYELRKERFALSEIVTEAVSMVRCNAETKGLELDIRFPAAPITVEADPRAMRHMLINLLANAVKFTDEGLVCLEGRLEDEDLILTVTDTGIGIEPDQLGKLGHPFVQASCGHGRHFEGTGLGLAYVKGMAELHGGLMQIESHIGQGTSVTLRLPLTARLINDNEDKNIVALDHARNPNLRDERQPSVRRSA
ncbi:MAG: HAMP domain-containing histidine kinase [Fulvimarina manganoxydans]|uniref:sensor histidine kinase n=1 Tax=Fulvimarina manganoxydans TaxID=937218 RepID=UPI0023530F38|nr:HAMP domain-containing sensor histidine kinase [Fulvimarina manganoxydans]MCK5933456.1 HAMP domain-containing histidine kinase [Fulvimarina manganoxydans]